MPEPSTTDRSTPVAPLDPAQVLEDAADVILARGWCRYQPMNGVGEVCLLGAIAVAEGVFPTKRDVIAELYAISDIVRRPAALAMAEHLGHGTDPLHVWMWNDDPVRTEDDVRDALLLVAKDLRNEARP